MKSLVTYIFEQTSNSNDEVLVDNNFDWYGRKTIKLTLRHDKDKYFIIDPTDVKKYNKNATKHLLSFTAKARNKAETPSWNTLYKSIPN